MKRLVVATHGDDEVLGCGGVLAKYPADTHVVVMAELSPIRRQEAFAARDVLGYRDLIEVEGFIDGHVGDDPKRLVSKLDEVLMVVEPDVVYVPSPGSHQDHRSCFEAGVRACRLSMSRIHWSPRSVMVYDDLVYDLELYQTGLQWTTVEELTEIQVKAKAEALACYASQSMPGAHPANGTWEIAKTVGSAVGVAFGERFAVLRDIR